jgi:hypothetical protein
MSRHHSHRNGNGPGADARARRRRIAALIVIAALARAAALAQAAPPPAGGSLFRDPEDGAFDISAWAATNTGFIPVLSPITEPAVGYGAALGLVLVHGGGFAGIQRAPKGVTGKPVPPDVSVVGGALTENETWAAIAGHVGFWGGDRWRYLGGVGYLSPRLDTYTGDGAAFGFTLDGWALVQELRRRVALTDLFVGARYLLLDASVAFDSETLPPELGRPHSDVRDAALGLVAEYDTRDNTFTPSRGEQVTAAAMFFEEAIGSDRTYQRYTLDGLIFRDPHPRLVLAGRLRTQSVRGDEPFYARPYVRLRGIPAMRYQGETAVSADIEARWALTPRWWLVGFAGAGWTDAGDVRVLDDESVLAGGAGFRYLIARALGLQMGLDVAKGPEEWAAYVVFGSSW